ncbi:nitroreductase family protein [Pseudomonas corrugata]|uniref:nitroreductase family protein n=1 Tax=Pseudomonas corrugata TaxID=47879 RepID=UPI0022348591|nr:nitroreductase [Pseudomonas corrugata]UZE08979.1 nitroreductase [Pseudomonas corrugata]
MNLTQAISGRRSTRDYTSEPVDEKLIYRLIEAAVQAPSAMNQQPWTFTVIRDQALLERVSREAKAWMLATMPAGNHSSHFQALLGQDSFQIFHHAPVLVLISGNAPGQWMVEDCALAAENLMLAAYAEGLGTCWIGFAQGFLNTPQGKHALGLASEWTPVAPIIVGHPKSAPVAIAHKPPEIHWIG